jgi:hypothetical protein
MLSSRCHHNFRRLRYRIGGPRKFVLAVFRTVFRLSILIGVIGMCLSVFITTAAAGDAGGDLLLRVMVLCDLYCL